MKINTLYELNKLLIDNEHSFGFFEPGQNKVDIYNDNIESQIIMSGKLHDILIKEFRVGQYKTISFGKKELEDLITKYRDIKLDKI